MMIRSTAARFVATSDLTGGRYGLYRWDMAPKGGGATPHFHRTFSESFYVVAGTPDLYDGTGWKRAGNGDFLFVPDGGIHGFRNESDGPVSMLILFAPGPPRERYFEELAGVYASGRTLTDEEWRELWARHDQFPAADVSA
jgi:mannose-6-phosphate isomerase-like protein (cupin superfamily)